MSFTFHKPIPVVCFLLLYHIPPLFSIVLRRPSRCFYMFGIQIPVDACSPFGLKRRSFLFVIDKKGLSEHRRIEKRYSDSFYFTKRRDAMKRSFHRELLKLNFRIALSNDEQKTHEDFP